MYVKTLRSGVLSCLFLLFIGTVYTIDASGQQTGLITITSTPPNAEVFLGGKSRGLTPVELELPGGDHQILLRLVRHELLRATITIAVGFRDTKHLELRLQREYRQGQLEIGSNIPEGFWISIGGVRRDVSEPLTEWFNPGNHSMGISNDEQDYSGRVRVEAGRITTVTFEVPIPIAEPERLRSVPSINQARAMSHRSYQTRDSFLSSNYRPLPTTAKKTNWGAKAATGILGAGLMAYALTSGSDLSKEEFDSEMGKDVTRLTGHGWAVAGGAVIIALSFTIPKKTVPLPENVVSNTQQSSRLRTRYQNMLDGWLASEREKLANTIENANERNDRIRENNRQLVLRNAENQKQNLKRKPIVIGPEKR